MSESDTTHLPSERVFVASTLCGQACWNKKRGALRIAQEGEEPTCPACARIALRMVGEQ